MKKNKKKFGDKTNLKVNQKKKQTGSKELTP